MFPRELGDIMHGATAGGSQTGSFHVPDIERSRKFQKSSAVYAQIKMLRSKSFRGHLGSIGAFINHLAAIKPDSERFDLLSRSLNGQTQDRR